MHDKNVYSLVLINSCKLRSFKCFSSHSFPSLVPRSFSIHFPLLHLILSSYSLLSISILFLQSFLPHSFPTSSIRTKSNPYTQLPIYALYEHHWSSSRRLGRADEAICQVSFKVSLHLHRLHCRLSVDAPPRRGFAWQKVDLQVVFAMRRERVGLLLKKDVQKVVVSLRNLYEKVGVDGGREVASA